METAPNTICTLCSEQCPDVRRSMLQILSFQKSHPVPTQFNSSPSSAVVSHVSLHYTGNSVAYYITFDVHQWYTSEYQRMNHFFSCSLPEINHANQRCCVQHWFARWIRWITSFQQIFIKCHITRRDDIISHMTHLHVNLKLYISYDIFRY